MDLSHVTQLPIPLFWLRVLVGAAGMAVLLFAWNTGDSIWSPFYWIDRVRGGDGEDINIRFKQAGGMTRGKYIIAGLILIAVAVFGKSFLALFVADIARSAGQAGKRAPLVSCCLDEARPARNSFSRIPFYSADC